MSLAYVKLETGDGRSKGDDMRIARVQPVIHVEFVRVMCRGFLISTYTVLEIKRSSKHEKMIKTTRDEFWTSPGGHSSRSGKAGREERLGRLPSCELRRTHSNIAVGYSGFLRNVV